MATLTRRDLLRLSAATAGLWLAACQPIQAPTPVPPPTAVPLPTLPPAPEAVEVNLLEAQLTKGIQWTIDYLMEQEHVPGISMGIIKDGEVVFAKGYGVTKVDTEEPVTTQTIFRIMDLTHSFTAAAAMQLVEQGKLELDAPVVEYLPYFKLASEAYTQITLRHLLAETAGLPLTPEGAPRLDWEGKTPQTDDGALERYVRSLSDVKLAWDPGRFHEFCNMAYDIAGAVIAQVSGEVFEGYMAQHILQPLGLTSSTFYPEQVDPARLAAPHVVESGKVIVSDLVTHSRERAPSVGLFTTLTDLLRWTQANLNRGELDGARILQASSYDEIWGASFDLGGAGDFEARGLGWYIGTRHDQPVSQVWGSDVGFHSALYMMPDQRTAGGAMGNQFTGKDYTGWYAYTAATIGLDLLAL